MSTEDVGSSARTLAYRADHRFVSCGPSRRRAITQSGPTAQNGGHGILPGQVLADQDGEGEEIRERDDPQPATLNVDGFPPVLVERECPLEPVAPDLGRVETPPVVLVLPGLAPTELGFGAAIQTRFRRRLESATLGSDEGIVFPRPTNAGDQHGDALGREDVEHVVDLILVKRRLRQYDRGGVPALPSFGDYAFHSLEIEPSLGLEGECPELPV